MKTVTVAAAKRFGITYCSPDTTLNEVAKRLSEEDISCLVVEDAEGYLNGIITRTDILRAALTAPDTWRTTPCSDWMTKNVITVEPDTLLQTAAEILHERGIHRVVVARKEGERLRPLGVVSDGDVVYHLAKRGV